MSAQILDGKALSKRLNKALKAEIDGWARKPGLAVVLVGNDPASEVYVRLKGKVAGRIGIRHRQIDLPADTSEADLLAVVRELNEDDDVDGILVQFPVPDQISQLAVLDTLDPAKDVDGLTAANVGLLSQGRPALVSCTPAGVMRLLAETDLDTTGKHAVVVGRSNIVGRPQVMLLEQANCTVTVCHSRTTNLAEEVARADILVAAVGRPEMIQGDWIKPGAVVLDVGVNRLPDGRLVGDVDYAAASKVASAITPVPGGCGPMTIAMLMHNTKVAAERRRGQG